MITIQTIGTFAYRSFTDDFRDNIKSPFEWKDNICATDGNVMVIVPKILIKDFDKLGPFTNDKAPRVGEVIKHASKQTDKKSLTWKDLIILFKKVDWKTINTEKHTVTDECPTCGNEEASMEVDRHIRKKVFYSPFKLDGFGVNAKHLLMTSKLLKIYPDGWKYYISHNGESDKDIPKHTVRFVNKNGIKVLMMGIRL